MSARGLSIEPAPAGKTVGQIHVLNHEVFSEQDSRFPLINSFLQLANRLHRTTREDVVRREVLLQPGNAYDESLAEETTRNLSHEDVSSLVVVLPVVSSDPGKVDLLVVTRDVWSLRFNTDFEHQQGTLVRLSTSLSENNFFGWRKRASLAFNLNQGQSSFGPSYFDPNVAGTRLTFSASAAAYYGREQGTYEGAGVQASLAYPLYSLATRWGGGISGYHDDTIARGFRHGSLARVDLQATPAMEDLPWTYKVRRSGFGENVIRSFGTSIVQRVSAGHSFSVRRTAITDDFPVTDEATRAQFLAEWGGADERVSRLYLGYSLFTPRYRVYRDFNTFDLTERLLLGPSVSLSVSRALTWLGSEVDFVGLGAGLGWAFDLADGFQSVYLAWAARRERGVLFDRVSSANLYLASPMLLGALRVVASAGGTVLENPRTPSRYQLGGEDGLRGYSLGEFLGFAQFLAHAELRSRSLSLASLRLGGLVFYDVGHAADTVSALRPHHDAGLGLRLLIPQFNYYVLRLDWAFAFQGTAFTRAGWPGRVSLGFRQVF